MTALPPGESVPAVTIMLQNPLDTRAAVLAEHAVTLPEAVYVLQLLQTATGLLLKAMPQQRTFVSHFLPRTCLQAAISVELRDVAEVAQAGSLSPEAHSKTTSAAMNVASVAELLQSIAHAAVRLLKAARIPFLHILRCLSRAKYMESHTGRRHDEAHDWSRDVIRSRQCGLLKTRAYPLRCESSCDCYFRILQSYNQEGLWPKDDGRCALAAAVIFRIEHGAAHRGSHVDVQVGEGRDAHAYKGPGLGS